MSPDVTKLKLDTPYCNGDPIKPASEVEVLRFEKMLGCSLPTDYRNFLLEVNGGIPCCNPPPQFRANNGSHFRLSDLYNFGIKNKYAMLPGCWKNLRVVIPRFLLPFGLVGADNTIAVRCVAPEKHPDYFGVFLGLNEPVRGQIFLVSSKNFGANAMSKEAEFLSASGVFKVADSFTDFINRLEC